MNRWLMSAIFLAGVLGWASGAHGFLVRIYADPGRNEPQIFDNGPGVVSLYVIVEYSTGLKGVGFYAPLPSCFEGATWLSDTPVYPWTMGTSQTGVSVAWETCQYSAIHVLTINVMAQGLTEGCCQYPVLPSPYSPIGAIEGADCSDNLITGLGYTSFVSNAEPGPPLVANPSPPEGETNQPLDTKLQWSVESQRCGCPSMLNRICFGTVPDPPIDPDFMWEYTTFDPGLLQPNTTYYWKVLSFYCCPCDVDEATTGPVWSFTTRAGVPVAPTTWGRIKSLYES